MKMENDDGNEDVDVGGNGESEDPPYFYHCDRSYVDCYDRNSHRCTRFDEREFLYIVCDFLLFFLSTSLHFLLCRNNLCWLSFFILLRIIII